MGEDGGGVEWGGRQGGVEGGGGGLGAGVTWAGTRELVFGSLGCWVQMLSMTGSPGLENLEKNPWPPTK
jgi:hypothetical protein